MIINSAKVELIPGSILNDKEKFMKFAVKQHGLNLVNTQRIQDKKQAEAAAMVRVGLRWRACRCLVVRSDLQFGKGLQLRSGVAQQSWNCALVFFSLYLSVFVGTLVYSVRMGKLYCGEYCKLSVLASSWWGFCFSQVQCLVVEIK